MVALKKLNSKLKSFFSKFKKKNLNFSKQNIIFYCLSIFIIIFDQLSKFFFMNLGTVEILPFFSFYLIENTGAGFGILKDQIFFLSLISISMIFVVFYLKTYYGENKLVNISLAFILGGTVGNLIDRLFRKKIIDFLYFHFQWFNYPAFNFADSFIFVGTIIFIILMLRKSN
jgi:signal peptidase II